MDYPSDAVSCANYDPATSRLFVCDTYNNRIMVFETSAGSSDFMKMLPN